MGENRIPPCGELTLRTLAMPGDANAAGDIFGGWVMAQMDLACGIRAAERARGRGPVFVYDAFRAAWPECAHMPGATR